MQYFELRSVRFRAFSVGSGRLRNRGLAVLIPIGNWIVAVYSAGAGASDRSEPRETVLRERVDGR